ncbi:MAG: porin family protein [Pseudomonadota bacterium]|nr:MAG: porin family protein [Pseudomonadota bacterium]
MFAKLTITSILAASCFLFSMSAQAGSESGFYVGASVGQSTIKAKGQTPAGDDFDFSEDDTGYKVFGGYNFGIIPLLDLAVEGSYVDLGNPNGTLADGTKAEYELAVWDAFGLVALTFGPFSVFGKAGVAAWDSDINVGGSGESESGSDPAYGVGAKFQIRSFAIRAEFEYFDIGKLNDVYLASVGLSYTF